MIGLHYQKWGNGLRSRFVFNKGKRKKEAKNMGVGNLAIEETKKQQFFHIFNTI
jgi:hypothetical protein